MSHLLQRTFLTLVLIFNAGCNGGTESSSESSSGSSTRATTGSGTSSASDTPTLRYGLTSSVSIGDPVSITPAAISNVQSISISPALPSGLSLNTSTGTISGAGQDIFSGTFNLTATSPKGTTSTSSLSLQITNIAPSIRVSRTSQQVIESSGTISIPMSIDSPLSSSNAYQMSVPYTITGEVGASDVNLPLTGTLSIPNGQTSFSQNITLIGNGAVNSEKRLILTLGTPTLNTPTPKNGTLGSPSQSVVSILDSDQVLPTAISVASGSWADHACSILSSGALKCWGYNNYSQLGDGTTTNRTTPVSVPSPLNANVTKATGGQYHTCAVLSSGALYCWGSNGYGVVGDGTTTDRVSPQRILSSSTVADVAAGAYHTCAVLGSGALHCWGNNGSGQLGDGTNTSRTSPVQIIASGVSTVSTGFLHTCAVLTSGAVQCWGSNSSGQLGDGSTTALNSPFTVINSGIAQVSAGASHTCAVSTSGALYCWGSNSSGRLGDGSTSSRTSPVQILSSGVAQVSAGSAHTCAVRTSGALQCWGLTNSGQIGNGSSLGTVYSPLTVISSGVAQVSTGHDFTCATLTSGSIQCWGLNGFGELGNGTTSNTNASLPGHVFRLTNP